MEVNNNQQVTKRSPQLVERWEQKGGKFYLYCAETVLEVSVYAEDIIRFRFSPDSRFEADFSYALVDETPRPQCPFELHQEEDIFVLSTAKLRVQISQSLHIAIYNSEGQLITEDEKGFHWEPYKKHGGNIVYYSKKVQEHESFYGLGDKPCDFNLKGKRLQNWGSDTYAYEKHTDPLYKNIPFFMGLHNGLAYGFFIDNTFRMWFDFGHERPEVCSFWAKGGEMNYYFIYGPELSRVAQRYTQLTGTPELPPLWALGNQQSKWSYYPESKVREIAAKFREHRIPCDVIHIDIDYMDGFRCFTWDKGKFPDPPKMIKELREDGFKTIVIIDPGIKIDKDYQIYQEGIENDYFCRRADGPLLKGIVWPGLCHFPDFTRPDVRTWWSGLFKELIGMGIAGVWNDMNEPAVFEDGTFPNDVRHDFDGHPCSHRKAHNVYGMQMARATYKGVKRFLHPARPVVITRSCYSGAQRYSSVWTGDNLATWEHLQVANVQCQRLSISGISFVGSDIGGFVGQPTGELLVRWMQLAILHPFYRNHSSGDHGEQEPWMFGEEYLDAARTAVELRYKLIPYIYTVFRRYTESGAPMILPLVFLDQENRETHYRMHEFALGQDLLACPIVKSGDTGRILYLPKGQWYNYWSGTLHEGRNEVYADAPLDRMPMFARAGSIIPHYPVMQYVGERPVDLLTLHAYYTEKVSYSSELYEDAGDYYSYEQGEYVLKTFTMSNAKDGKGQKVTLSQEKEGSFQPSYTECRIAFYGLPFFPTRFEVDGHSIAQIIRDEQKNVYYFSVPENFKQIHIIK